MKLVNLSRRPFLNTRPVKRLSTLLWVVGGVLLLTNIVLYSSHFMGSSKGQERLDAVGRQIDQELEVLNEKAEELKSLELRSRNEKAQYLNTLIDARVFPWSALFGSLEEILPLDVYLASVKPSLGSNLRKGKTNKKTRSSRGTTAKEARERARAKARGETVEKPDEKEAPKKVSDNKDDLIRLSLEAYSKNDEALFELIENLYADPAFTKPTLTREGLTDQRVINFGVEVYYRPPNRGAPPPEEGDPEAVLQDEGEAVAETSVAEGSRVDVLGASNVEEGESSVEGEREPGKPVSVSRTRPVRRATSTSDRGLPPEEGEERGRSVESVEEPGIERRSRTRPQNRDTAKRDTSRSRPLPQATSIQPPSFVPAPTRENPTASDRSRPTAAPRATPRVGASPRPTSRPSARPTSRPTSRTRPSTTTGRPPAPTNLPSPASSSPRVEGTFLDRFLPEGFLMPNPSEQPAIVARTVWLNAEGQG